MKGGNPTEFVIPAKAGRTSVIPANARPTPVIPANARPTPVIPAKSGIQGFKAWTPASAGVTSSSLSLDGRGSGRGW